MATGKISEKGHYRSSKDYKRSDLKTKLFRFNIFFSFLFSLIAFIAESQTSDSFVSSWKLVDSIAEISQPKSALEIVDNIYATAQKNRNNPQVLKAIIYKIRLISDYQENFLINTIKFLEKEIHTSQAPVKQVLYSILAEVYWKYYQNNQYRFKSRSNLGNMIPDSIETWDLNAVLNAISSNYLASLTSDSLLKTVSIKDYSAILDKPAFDKNHQNYVIDLRPTLFDFLAHRVLDFFSSGEELKIHPVTAFQITNPGFFNQTRDFFNLKIITADSASLKFNALRIFQNLADFHYQDKNPAALIDLEIERFEFIKNNSIIPGKDSLYRDAMELFSKQFSTTPGYTEILYSLANFLFDRGQQYDPLISDKFKFDIKDAYEFCEKAIHAFPDAAGAAKCKNLVSLLTRPSVEITKEYAVPVGKPSPALIKFKNVINLSFRIFRADPESFNEQISRLKEEQLFTFINSLPVVKSWNVRLPSDGDFQFHSLETEIPDFNSGFYVLLSSLDSTFKDPKLLFTHITFWSSDISYISLRNEDGSIGYYILDRETGKPLGRSLIEAWTENYSYKSRNYEKRKLGNFVADESGYFLIPPVEAKERYSNVSLKIRYKNDFLISNNFYQYPVSEPKIIPVPVTWFFTDRGIYRPGQTIYFKGILLSKYGDTYKILPDSPTKVVFTDVNGQKVAEQTMTTNEYGSFNGVFIAPQGVLSGDMTISNGSGSIQISVEEYKRPSFEVLFNPVEGNYKLGETVQIGGKAKGYAGNNIDNATMKYRVARTARFPWWGREWYCPFPNSPEMEIVNGVAKTSADGSFMISFTAIPDYSVDKINNPVFDYTVSVEVTDINGETQSAEQNISVGYISLFVNVEIPEKFNCSRDSILKISTLNLNGRRTPATVTVTLQRLHQPDRIFKSRIWTRPDIDFIRKEKFHELFPNDIYDDENNPENWRKEQPVMEKSFNIFSDSIFNLKTLDPAIFVPGYYLITTRSVDPFGQTVTGSKYFTVFDPRSEALAVNNLNWFVPVQTSGQPGENAEFLIGSKEKNVHMLVEIRMHDSIISRRWIELDDEQRLVRIPIKEQYRGNFNVNFLFTKHNRIFQNSQIVNVPYSDKNLEITFETFRDKLDPGKEEEWKLRITSADKKAAEAELLMSMYDASLDVFHPNNWSFNLYKQYFSFSPWNITDAFRTITGSLSAPVSIGEGDLLKQYPSLNWFGLHYFGVSGFKRGRFDREMVFVSGLEQSVPGKGEALLPPEASAGNISLDSVPALLPGTSLVSKQSGIQVRRDFRETAFFYPSLLSDSSGNLIIKFTIPESLTRWKIQGLAYTKNLDYGLITKDIVTRKDLMVFPNVPRFLRQGDTIVFSTRIVNLSEHALSGNVLLGLSDGLSGESLDSLVHSDLQQSFTTSKDGSSSVSWKIIIPYDPGLSVLNYRIYAKAGGFSDAEEKVIPVFPNRMLVTESLPLPVRGNGVFGFHFDKLLSSGDINNKSKTAKNYRLTLEFASNPVWYAIQALPSLNERKYDNADFVFASYYSNEVASFLIESNPSVRAVFESWKTFTPDALQSNLEKNQQLKSALLQETPWVLEAQNETARKQKLGLYFDRNLLRSSLELNLNKLVKLQAPGGGWPWFEGMPESRYVSQNILTGFGRLYHLGIRDFRKDKKIWNMILKSIDFLDLEIRNDFENLKKNTGGKLEGNHLGSLQIQYFYSRSFFMNYKPVPAGTKEAFDYYLRQAKKYWLQYDFYLQGMIALSLKRLESDSVPSLIIKSLTEKALHSDEMGMYWARQQGWFWYQAPVESQAMLIEAFDEISNDKKSVDEMKIWLLKQKQIRMWETSRATVDAIYALILRGTNFLSEDPGITINIGNEKIDPAKFTDTKKEAGTGYFQLSWSGKEIKPEMGKITINKTSAGVAWGAVYWQYFENLDRITKAQTPVKIDKKLFVENNTPSGPVINPVSSDRLLHVGDKIKVRIVLTVDRDLEFVHMKDLRAAAFEPVLEPVTYGEGGSKEISGYRYLEGLGYYQSTTDQAVNFFFDNLPKGTYVFEYSLKVNASGEYSNGITTVQCMYAPEFSAHSEGIRVNIEQ